MNNHAFLAVDERQSTPEETIAPVPQGSRLLDSSLQFADRHFHQGNLKAACDFLALATELAPDNVEILAAQGALQFQLGNLESARGLLAKATQLAPNRPALLTQLATVCLRLDDKPAFESAISQALDLDPLDLAALKLLAGYLFDCHAYASAARLHHCILKQQPDDIPTLLALGKCFHQVGDNATARMVFERILSLEPDHALARENLAVLGEAQAETVTMSS
jgi:Flp pilus assembly protein TadD